MENQTPVVKQPNPIRTYIESEPVKNKFKEMMGGKSTAFISSLLSIVNNSEMLKNAVPESVYMSAMMAATLDLPINPNLGFAYIIPYNEKYKDANNQWKSRQIAQFQLGYKGFIQLAQRSGQFKTISACKVYEGQLVEENPLTGYLFDFKKKTSDNIIGYAAYFSLINGFEKTDYWTVNDITEHAKKFSKSFANENGIWKKDFPAMAMKTALKLLLSKYAPLSVEMQKAIIADQGVIKNVDTLDVEYVDAEPAKSVEEKKKAMKDKSSDSPKVEMP